jgi:hypothetical protein
MPATPETSAWGFDRVRSEGGFEGLQDLSQRLRRNASKRERLPRLGSVPLQVATREATATTIDMRTQYD